MLKLLTLSVIQCAFLTASQIFLKFAMGSIGNFSFSWKFFSRLLTNWQFACSGISIALASILWFHIIRNYDFSIAYPMISLSYVFGILAAVFIFNEPVPVTRWIGVAFIIVGVVLIARN